MRVTADGVSYGLFKASNFVPWSRVDSLEPEIYRFSRYRGWVGVGAIGGARDRAYSLLGYKRGVRLRFQHENGRAWSVFLASRDPEAICRITPPLA